MDKQKKLPSIRTFATDKKLTENAEPATTKSEVIDVPEKRPTESIEIPKPPISKEKVYIKAKDKPKTIAIPVPPIPKRKPKEVTSKKRSIPQPPVIEDKKPVHKIPRIFAERSESPKKPVSTVKPHPEKTKPKRSKNKNYGPATIITDTKKDRFRLFPALIESIKSWFEENKKAYKASKKPKYTVPETTRRKGVIQKATSITGPSAVSDHTLIHERIKQRKEEKEVEKVLELEKEETASVLPEGTTTWSAKTEPGYPLLENDLPKNVQVVPRKSFQTSNQEIVVTDLSKERKAIKQSKETSWEEEDRTEFEEENEEENTNQDSPAPNETVATDINLDEEDYPAEREQVTSSADTEDDRWGVSIEPKTSARNRGGEVPAVVEKEEITQLVQTEQDETEPEESRWGEDSKTENIPEAPTVVTESPQQMIQEIEELEDALTTSKEITQNEEVTEESLPENETQTNSDQNILKEDSQVQKSVWGWGGQKGFVPEPKEEELSEETPDVNENYTEKENDELNDPWIQAQNQAVENEQQPVTDNTFESQPEQQPVQINELNEKEAPLDSKRKTDPIRSFLFETDINVLVFYIFTAIIVISIIFLNVNFGTDVDTKNLPKTPVVEQPYLIEAPLKIIYLPQPTKTTIIGAIDEARNQQTDITQLALAVNEDNTTLIPPKLLLSILEIEVEPTVAENITHLYFGYVKGENPYLALKVTDTDLALEGMLNWEKTLYNDFISIVKTKNPTTSSSPSEFYDAMLGGINLRLLEDASGNEKLIYGSIDNNVIIITTDSLTFAELSEINK